MDARRVFSLAAVATAATVALSGLPPVRAEAGPQPEHIEMQVTGRHGIPADATAVALNVTVTNARDAGFVTVWPCGVPRPEASNLNFTAGQTIPNLVVTRVGTGGTVCLESSTRVDLIADHAGWFPAGSDFTPLAVPVRLMDTRAGTPTARVGAGGSVELQVGGRAGIAADPAAVVMNITAVDPAQAGYVTVWPCGSRRPNASNLNVAAGRTIANLVVSGVGVDGRVCVHSSAAVDLIADVSGWFPAGSAYRPLVPIRMLDTRPGAGTFDGRSAGAGTVAADTTLRVPIIGRGPVDDHASVVVMNVTAADPQASGFVTVFACDTDPPPTSNLNLASGDTVPNLVVSRVSTSGEVCVATTAASHLIVDVSGVFPADGGLVAPIRPARLLDTRTSAAADGPLTPYVVCVSEFQGAAWFGYENGSGRPVAVPEGPRNRLEGTDARDAPRPPVLFGTGRVEPAFFAAFDPFVDERDEPVLDRASAAGDREQVPSTASITWTLVGPDGVERSAVATPDGPACEPDRITFDDRRIEIELVDVTASGRSADVRVEVTGDVTTSVCAAGLTPLPPASWVGDVLAPPRPGSTASFRVTPGPSGLLTLRAWILDRCGFEGLVSGSWPIIEFPPAGSAFAEWCVVSTPSGPQVDQERPWDCDEPLGPPPGGWVRPG